MPELPEVENVKRTLKDKIVSTQIVKVLHIASKIRYNVPSTMADLMLNATIINVARVAKYLAIQLNNGQYIICHLGMSGKLEVAHNSQPLPHKHMELLLSNGFYLRFIDPRRFGMLDICDNLQKYRLFLHLGIEPLSQQLTTEWLYAALQKSHGNIKAFLMNQKHIVGIGNIYASEILFLAKISPLRISNAIKLIEIQQIITAIVQIISSAIEGGGSTLRDYVRADGTAGQFQHQHMVYGKQDQMCNTCHNLIAKIIQSGRSTFFCPNCQK